MEEFHAVFDVQPDCPADELHARRPDLRGAGSAGREARLGSLAYYYNGTGNAANEDAISSIILGTSLLTARGIPVAGEYEIKNVQAMKIMDTFGAAAPSPNTTRWTSTTTWC